MHHVNNISIAPIGPQKDQEFPNHLVFHTQGRPNVPLLDILLPQEGAPPIVQMHEQFDPAPLLEVSQVIDPLMALLLPM